MRAKEFTVKQRDPNWKTLQAKRTSGAAGAHKDKKKEQKQGYEKHKKSPIDEAGVSYGQMPADAVRVLHKLYQDVSQGVEQYRDEQGAQRISNELDDASKSLGVSQYMRSLYNSASHRAHMDFDTNPGHFKNWFPYVGDALESLFKIHQEKGSYQDEEDVYPDEAMDRFESGFGGRNRADDWDEGNTEPPNNFAVYINGKKWKVFAGRGTYADDAREIKQYYDLKAWAARKSDATGKKWEISRTGEPATESIEENTDIPFDQCPQCRGPIFHESLIQEKQDACYHKVRSRYKVWPSAYASGALVQCRKKGAKNWGNKSK